MTFRFRCSLCAREVGHGARFEIVASQYQTAVHLTSTVVQDDVCSLCHGRVSRYIDRIKEATIRRLCDPERA